VQVPLDPARVAELVNLPVDIIATSERGSNELRWWRNEGRAAVADFIDRSMVGLEDWTFPEQWTMADGDPEIRPRWHQWMDSAPDWEPIPDDGLERFDDGRPRA
jgi:hypothetical protein